jgi:hypothetical protein
MVLKSKVKVNVHNLRDEVKILGLMKGNISSRSWSALWEK